MSSSSRLIDQHKRLIPPRVAETYGIGEYVHAGLDNRWVLDIPAYDAQVDTYRLASEARLPVFSAFGWEGSLLLMVPKGTRSLARSHRFIARDVDNYREIFRQVGEIIGRVTVAGFGVVRPTVEGSVLSKFAFSPQTEKTFGGQVYLMPPYGFDVADSNESSLALIEQELKQARYFKESQVHSLVQAVVEGTGLYEQ